MDTERGTLYGTGDPSIGKCMLKLNELVVTGYPTEEWVTILVAGRIER